MKGLRKLSSLLLTAFLVMTMAIPAFAAPETTTLVIEDKVGGTNIEDSEFQLYRLISAKTNNDEDFSYFFENNEKGKKYREILSAIMGNPDATVTQIAKYIQANTADSESLIQLQNKIYEKIKENSLEADYKGKATSYTVNQGYYLIVETKKGGNQDVTSLHMLKLAGKKQITVKTKQSVPTLEKEVKEVNDTTGEAKWQKFADHDAATAVKDDIEFRLTATIPEKLNYFKAYQMKFQDKMDKGLSYSNNAKLFLVNENNDAGVEVNAGLYNVTSSDAQNFTLAIPDIKKIPQLDQYKKLQVRYTATLNDQAVIGKKGNKNTAYLQYSSDPNHAGGGELVNTPEQTVKVFTYEIRILKVDGDNSNKPLNGATFSLYKKVKEGADTKEVLVEKIEGANQSSFKFKGLDAGEYVLKEDEPPAGYNAIDDIHFNLKASFNEGELVGLAVATTAKHGANAAGTALGEAGGECLYYQIMVENNKGGVLPETGGMGTTMLYLSGAILSLGAGIVLVSRKRMNINK